MPRIIVTADRPVEGGQRPVMFTERVSVRDFESDHFQAQLVQRIGWAVGDAAAVEQRRDGGDHPDACEQDHAECGRDPASGPLRVFRS
jgi:hypothetical protein